jgi:hypothetical protein
VAGLALAGTGKDSIEWRGIEGGGGKAAKAYENNAGQRMVADIASRHGGR